MPRYTRKTLPRELAETDRWPKADISGLDIAARRDFFRLATSLKKYLRFEVMSSYLKSVHLTSEQVLRALNRCVTFAPDGRIYGWCGLIRNTRVVVYCRKSPIVAQEILSRGGYAGALQRFWQEHPELRQRFDKFLLAARQDASMPESTASPSVAHRYFMQLCREAALTQHHWPFCTESLGRGAIARYRKTFIDTHYDKIVKREFGEKANAKSRTGTGKISRLRAFLPFDIVEIDEHSVHFIGSIGISTPKGIRWLPVGRLTLLIAVDRDSQVVLAYVAIFRRAATTEDLLKLIAKALRPWEPREFALPGMGYPEDSGFPSGLVHGLERCGWSQLLIDNALIHLAYPILERTRRVLGASVSLGAVKRPERRPIVENTFRQLERAGFQRLPSTTGSHPTDPHRQDPEAKATKFKMSMEAILDLIDVTIAKYNRDAGAGNFALGGLDYLRSIVGDETRGFLRPTLPPRLPCDPELDTIIEHGVIAGSRSRGERPHVTLDGALYTNAKLAKRWDLLGRIVRKYVNVDNLQTFEAYLDDGTPLGELTVLGRWSRSPHSREVRRQINAALRSRELVLRRGEDPVAAWKQRLAAIAVAKGKKGNQVVTTSEATRLAEENRRNDTPFLAAKESTRAIPEIPTTSSATACTEQIRDPHIKAIN